MLIAIDHGKRKGAKPFTGTPSFPVYRKVNQHYGRDVLKYGGSYYTLSAQRIPYRRTKPQTSGSLSCRYLPLRRKSKHRTLILPG